MRILQVTGGLLLAVLLAGAALLWSSGPPVGKGELLVPPKTPFTKGRYYLFVQPWGGESYAPTRWWSRRADAGVVNLKHFPADTKISWRWPPMAPPNDAGVWGFNQVSFGNYDGGAPEAPTAPVRVRDIKMLRQTFRWSLDQRFGDGDILTEFYLHPTSESTAAKVIEIGWFLHTPPTIRAFFQSSPLIGTYIDGDGRRWTVRMGGTYCMFAPEQPGDVPAGRIDMLHALQWLHDKGRITGNEWFAGVAIGVEPVRGIGSLDLHEWQVTLH